MSNSGVSLYIVFVEMHICLHQTLPFVRLPAGRSQKVKPEVIQKFNDFATSHGFPKDAILTPPPAGSSLSMDTHTDTNSPYISRLSAVRLKADSV